MSIGFMQGRLSPLVGGRIQAFPWDCWQAEFAAARDIGLGVMEWTLDQDRLYENPLLTPTGQQEILSLASRHDVLVHSLTGDCFMQAPFWKAAGEDRTRLETDFMSVAGACHVVGIKQIVVPLVDNGSLKSADQEDLLIDFLLKHQQSFAEMSLQVLFESDYTPINLSRFIDRLPKGGFGVNYDTGNSAALGFDPADEFSAYGDRVLNVHIKDRVLGGTTVPLGQGNANFPLVFRLLKEQRYRGNLIMQTARAQDDEHAAALIRYRTMINAWFPEAS